MKALRREDVALALERGDYAVAVVVTRDEAARLSKRTVLEMIDSRLERARLELLEQLEARGLWRSDG